jgi:hypothetical protein
MKKSLQTEKILELKYYIAAEPQPKLACCRELSAVSDQPSALYLLKQSLVITRNLPI